MAIRFLRTDHMRYSRLGKKRKKLQKWRRAKGRHNKTRQKWFGYPRSPTVGFKKPTEEAGKIDGKIPVLVRNLKDLEKVGKDNVVIVAKIGAKKKMEVIKKAMEMKIQVKNVGGQKEK